MKKKLLDICDFQGGTQPPKNEWISEPRDGYVRMLQIRDYTQGDEKYIEYVLDNGKLHKCKTDDIMLSRYGYIGQAFMGLEGAYNVALVKVIKKEDIQTKYLFYYFKSEYFQHHLMENVGARATIPGFNKLELKKAVINIPDKSSQDYIADVLSKIDGIITIRKRQLQIYDELIKARFVEMFGDPEYNNKRWPIKKLSDLCNVGSSKRIYQEEQTMDGVPFWRISDLVAKIDTGNVESSLYIPESRYEELKTQGLVPKPGDILVTSRGTLGRCYIVTLDDRFYFQDGMISWLSKYSDEITPLFIQYLFDMSGFRKQIDGLQAGSTVAYLSIAMLKKLNVMLPDRKLQEQFAAFVSQTDKSKVAVQATLNKTKLLFDKLMQQYFG